MAQPLRVPAAPPTVYFPFENGRYEVKAGLYQLGKHAVHGVVEEHVFALDREYGAYLEAKVAARTQGLHRYYQQAALPPSLREAVLRTMLAKLAVDSGGFVTWQGEALTNALLGWSARVDLARGTLEELKRFPAPLASLVTDVQPLDALDFLALNAQEDYAIVARDPMGGEDWQACLHVCLPQHWDPRDKIGRPFGPVHAPVGGAAPLIATANKLMAAVIEKGPFLRFAWGIATSARLNHHPESPPDADRGGGDFDPDKTFLRVERQTLWGFPAEQGAFFTIRPYVYPLRDAVRSEVRRAQLALALRSMTREHLAYKGMERLRDPLVAWLET